ncbi:MAG TPA: hypothetical protein VI121_08175, partial [Agromyces sp.]
MNTARIDPETGEVTHKPVLKKHPITRRHRVVVERVERSKRVDSRFDTRRAPIKWKTFHPRNIGVVYLYALIWVVFTLWTRHTWLTWLTHRSVLNANAILMVVAIGLLVPLAAGVFDLSIAGTISASSVTVSWAIVEAGWPIPLGIAAGMAAAALVGVAVAIITVRLRGDYLAIVTLGFAETLRVVMSNEIWIANGTDGLSGIPGPFRQALGPHGYNLMFLGIV